MNEDQLFKLKSNLRVISRDLVVKDVFSHLLSSFAIEPEDVEVVNLELTSRAKAEKLVNILTSKDKNYFRNFYDSLIYAEYQHLADLLSESLDSVIEYHGDSSGSEDGPLPDIKVMLRNGGVPKLPNVYVDRSSCSDCVKNALRQLKVCDGFVILHGMAGCGKTLLAIDCLNDEQLIHECFPGGLFWVVIGDVGETKLLMKMQNLCLQLDEHGNRVPKNLEEARDRLRVLFSQEYPKSLLILDDIWSPTYLKYFDIRVRAFVTTRYSAIADRIDGLTIKVPLSETLPVTKSRLIIAKWLNCEDSQLPIEADQLICECKGYPLALSMIAALLKSHPTRWSYYLSQLRERKTSKVKSKLSYQYDTLYDAIAVSVDHLSSDLELKYKMLCIFEESTWIPFDVVTILWDLDDIECEDYLLELCERSLVHINYSKPSNSFTIQNIQVSFLKETAVKEDRLVSYHQLLIDRYEALCDGKLWTLKDDNYIHWHLLSHLLKSDSFSTAIDLCCDFRWLQVASRATTSSNVIASLDQVIVKATSDATFETHLLNEFSQFLRVYSHILSSKEVDLIQLALCQPLSKDICKHAKQALSKDFDGLYYEWANRPISSNSDLILTSKLHGASVKYCGYSSTSDRVVSCGSDQTVMIWRTSSGEEVAKLQGHTDTVNYSEFCLNDKCVISCSADKTIKVWCLEIKKEKLTILGHKDEVTCARVSLDAQRIVSSSFDNTVKLWNFQTGHLYCTFYNHIDVVNWCCFSHNSKLIASSSNDLTINVWSVDCHELQNEPLCTIGGDEDFIPFCMFLQNDQHILYCSLNMIRMSSVNDGTPVWSLDMYSDITSLALRCDEKYLAASHIDMSASLIDMKENTFIKGYFGHSSWLNGVSFSSCGQHLVTSSHDGLCKVWTVEKELDEISVLTDIFDAVFLNDEDYLVVAATRTNTVQVLHANGASYEGESRFESKISCCVISEDSLQCYIGFHDGTIAAMETESVQVDYTLSQHTDEITLLRVCKKRLLSVSSDNSCIVWCLSLHNHLYVFNGHDNIITDGHLLLQNELALSSSYDGTLALWSYRHQKDIFTCNHDGQAVLSCKISNNQEYIISSTADCECNLWDVSDGSLKLTIDDHDDAIRCCVFSNDDSMFATGSDDGCVKVWFTSTGDFICSCKGHTAWVNDIKFNNSCDKIVTMSNNIKVFNLNGNLLQTFYIAGTNLKFLRCTETFSKFITIDDMGNFYVLNIF